MRYKNSFFRLETKNDGTYLDLFPAVDNGKKLELREIIFFIEQKGCRTYSKELLKNALTKLADRPMQIKISDEIIEKYDECCRIDVSEDRLVAYIRFYPPTNGGKLMTKKEILAEFENAGIKYGILEKVLDVFLTARQYCLSIPMARGQGPIQPKDSEIKYHFNTKPLAKPKVLEDGSVDFHELNLFSRVRAGDVLAELIPHAEGQPGTDVYGNVILPAKPKVRYLKYGRNIRISKDKLSIASEVDGNVTLTDDTVFVAETYMVAADVDASTGDIEYDGSVLVPGNVRTGFTVKCKGDIQVNGVVEGATLIAGGNIVIKRGVQGMNKGLLQAGGDICAQFFESANIKTDGDITAGSILHSNIDAKGKILVRGKKGFIVGGEISCGKFIEVSNVGNKMETQTIIRLGMNDELYAELKTLAQEVSELNEEIEENDSYLNVYREKVKKGVKLPPDKLKHVQLLKSKLDEINNVKQEKSLRMNEIKKVLDEGKKTSIKVHGNAYRGVTIYIANDIYTVKNTCQHAWFKIVDGGITPAVF